MVIRLFACLLALFTIIGGGVCSTPADIYLCIGQSNMAGRGYLTPEFADTLNNVLLLNDKGTFEPAVNPLNRYSTIRKDMSMQRLSPAYSFGREMAERSGRSVGLVVNARGGSSIKSWIKGSADGYYEQALSRVREALRSGGKLRAVIWHQGEADSASPERYEAQIAQLISDLRRDLKMPRLPFVVGEISRWNWTSRVEGTEPFNAMLNRVAEQIPYCACVSSLGLEPLIDQSDPHFNAEGQIILGERYAQAVSKLMK